MATLTIDAFEAAAETALGNVLYNQQVAIGGGSLQSAAVDPTASSVKQFRSIRLFSDAMCYVQIGSDPTATTQFPMAAEQTEYRKAFAGDKVAVITRA